MKTAVVVTVLNERQTLPMLLEGIRAQTRPADEVVVVDAGSTDGTREYLEAEAGEARLRLIVKAGAGIGAGRNAGIAAATSPGIAVTDAGCRPEPGWLAALVHELESGAAVVSGVFVPEPRSRFERMVVALFTTPQEELSSSWNPSSRSMAFTRAAWAAVGGYPEQLPTAEDTVFCSRLRQAGHDFVLQKRAAVRWRPRTTFKSFFRQYLGYAFGDGLGRVSERHYQRKIAIYALFVLGGIAAAAGLIASPSLRTPLWLGLVVAWVLYHAWFALKMLRRGAGPWALIYEPVIVTAYDTAEIIGYLRGRIRPEMR